MENSKHLYTVDNKLRFAVVAYYAVMLGAFVIGLYGLLSLLWLASAEIQHSVQVLPPIA